MRWVVLDDRTLVANFGLMAIRLTREADDRGIERWHTDFVCESVRMPMSVRSLDIAKGLAETAARVLLEQAGEALKR